MRRALLGILLAVSLPLTALARVEPYPASFRTMDIPTQGAVIHVRVAGQGPAILMLHGFGDTGDMWQPLAIAMMHGHTVVVPDLRGMGLSSHPDTGYDKKTQAQDLAQVLDSLKAGPVDLVTHDIGNMVGYAFAAQYPQRVRRWVAMDAPLPGVGNWAAQLSNPKTWHFNFHGPDEERLVAGRERIFLDRFWNELSANPQGIDEQTRAHYARLYARPHAMHDAFEQFVAFPQDGVDNRAFLAKGKLAIPVLAIGGDHSYGAAMAAEYQVVATDVTEKVIADAGHWLMEEQPANTVAAIREFIDKQAPQKSTPAQLVDALNGLFGKQTTGRAVHAKGIVVEGSFTPAAGAVALSKAPHFATTVRVTARFSDFAGIPSVSDADPLASPRGLALKFHLPDGSDTDLVTHSFNGFPAPTADEFRQFLMALAASGPGVAKPTPADTYLAAHPIARTFLQTQPPPPVSYATVSYFGVNAFKFTNAQGKVTYGRYRIEPLTGQKFLTREQIATADSNYLATELPRRLANSPIRFKMAIQIAEAVDPLDDPSVAWPETRKQVEIGTLEITRVVPDSESQQRALLFMPLALPPGIEPEDPMLKARNEAYPVSYARRHQ